MAVAMIVNLLVVGALVLLFANAGRLFGPRGRRHEGDWQVPYETGMRPIEPALDKMSVLYYRFAVLFVVFDVDLAFLLPWALGRPVLDLGMMVSVTVFVALVGCMLAYLWRRGALECR